MNLAAVSTFFNPLGWGSRRHNYGVFRDHLNEQGIPLFVVECAKDEGSFDIPMDGLEHKWEYVEPDVLWQKERLFNLACEELVSRYDAIALLDADIVFQSPGWADATLDKIADGYAVVQPWSHAHNQRMGEKGEPPAFQWRDMTSSGRRWEKEGHVSASGPNRGHPGYATVYASSLLKRVGLYEKHIIGGGDTACIQATAGDVASVNYEMIGTGLSQGIVRWAKGWRAEIGRFPHALGHVPCHICHLFHGTMEARGYGKRYRERFACDISPEMIEAEDGRPLRWGELATDEAKKSVIDYFRKRNEDTSVTDAVKKAPHSYLRLDAIPPGGWKHEGASGASLEKLAIKRARKTGEHRGEARQAILLANVSANPDYFFNTKDPAIRSAVIEALQQT